MVMSESALESIMTRYDDQFREHREDVEKSIVHQDRIIGKTIDKLSERVSDMVDHCDRRFEEHRTGIHEELEGILKEIIGETIDGLATQAYCDRRFEEHRSGYREELEDILGERDKLIRVVIDGVSDTQKTESVRVDNMVHDMVATLETAITDDINKVKVDMAENREQIKRICKDMIVVVRAHESSTDRRRDRYIRDMDAALAASEPTEGSLCTDRLPHSFKESKGGTHIYCSKCGSIKRYPE